MSRKPARWPLHGVYRGSSLRADRAGRRHRARCHRVESSRGGVFRRVVHYGLLEKGHGRKAAWRRPPAPIGSRPRPRTMPLRSAGQGRRRRSSGHNNLRSACRLGHLSPNRRTRPQWRVSTCGSVDGRHASDLSLRCVFFPPQQVADLIRQHRLTEIETLCRLASPRGQ